MVLWDCGGARPGQSAVGQHFEVVSVSALVVVWVVESVVVAAVVEGTTAVVSRRRAMMMRMAVRQPRRYPNWDLLALG